MTHTDSATVPTPNLALTSDAAPPTAVYNPGDIPADGMRRQAGRQRKSLCPTHVPVVDYFNSMVAETG
ncbi:MAG TPA: hypothetical protein P5300_11810 [Acidobacteriota bacterium]|nr:hypothetical protein [Acidobacteriota bacterium]